MFNTTITKYFKWVLAGVLGIAGILKMIAPDNLVEVFLFFELFSETNAYIFVYVVAAIELILAAGLVINYKPRLTAVTVTTLCGIFLLISITGYLNNWELACGCLGEFTFGNFDGVMIVRNTVLLGLAGEILYKSVKGMPPIGGTITTKEEKS